MRFRLSLRRGPAALFAWIVAAVLLLVPAGAAQLRAEEHKDAKLGYSVNYPRKWLKRPLGSEEKWIVAKFESDREFETADKDGYYSRHRPWLDVVVIPLALEERKGGTAERNQDGDIVVRLAAPWKDLKGYLEKNLQSGEGGFFFSKEEETTLGGLRCIQYEVTFEKLIDNPKRVYAWAYYTSDAIYGVVGESLIKFEDKLKPDIIAALKSFKSFARTGALAGGEHTGEDIVVSDRDKESNVSDDEKAKRRDRKATERVARLKEQVGSDWIVRESAHFTAVSHADPKFTKAMLDHCEALRSWLDENLGYVGGGYPGRIVIRICADSEEHSALTKTGGWWGGYVEVNTFRDRDGWSDWSMQSLNTGVFDIWLRDKNQAVSWAFPAWVQSGLDELIGTAVSKGAKIEFKPSTWDRQEVAIARRDGKLPQAKLYFTQTREEAWSSGSMDTRRNAGMFTRFLVVGGARKNAKFKTIFPDYIKAVVLAVDEKDAKDAKARKAALDAAVDGSGEPASEQEEDAMVKKRQTAWAAEEKAFLDDLFKRVFSTWTAKDWDALTSAYWKDGE